jgi:hypothetical protein
LRGANNASVLWQGYRPTDFFINRKQASQLVEFSSEDPFPRNSVLKPRGDQPKSFSERPDSLSVGFAGQEKHHKCASCRSEPVIQAQLALSPTPESLDEMARLTRPTS